MILESVVVGSVFTNCYVLGCEKTRNGAIIDPGGDVGLVHDLVKKLDILPRYVINTHGHADHMSENGEMKKRYGAQILIHRGDAPMLTDPEKNLSIFMGPAIVSPPADRFVEERDIIEVGEVRLKVLHTPGHSPGSISLVGHGCAFTGDALFAGSIGRTDLAGGSHRQLLESIRIKLFPLADETRVCSGHGPESTIGWERGQNPFFQDGLSL